MALADRLIVARDEQPKLEDSIIILLIGKEESRYSIHGKTLLERSGGNFDESVLSLSGDERFIALPDITRSVCELYLHYLHVGNFPLRQYKTTIRQQRQHKEDVGVALIEIYSMSTTLGDGQGKDAAVSGLVEIFDMPGLNTTTGVPGATIVTRVYAVTEPGSKLRQLMVDLYVRKARGIRIDGPLPHHFVADLAGAALDAVESVDRDQQLLSPALDQCLYHEHEFREGCPNHTRKKLKRAEIDVGPINLPESDDPDLPDSPPVKRTRMDPKAGEMGSPAMRPKTRPASAATLLGCYSRRSPPVPKARTDSRTDSFTDSLTDAGRAFRDSVAKIAYVAK
ncbi:hypothetical protein CB0940_09559 [Cercospora beticola]|uniref:BTB domain-containing protein n=1 Tax=Cercospora beticola TaxID=122368 RepID=A0A2G5HHS1_CERBT|nr:hypothetical protein CB0940_09559 [Cercospora beticola]PIA92079.1 hypothetical protein CB0940_09559 [Cercospora beticola]WPB06113.1 hypothetical protein RHO25_010770 [Cercospora beticola]CAK1365996.1 unnamed protein product [Cercospora beticola]